MRTLIAAAAFTLACLAAPSFAADEPPEPQDLPGMDHPGKQSDEDILRHSSFCKENPQTCQTMKMRKEEREKYCVEHKAECEKLKAEKQARIAKREAFCKENPVKCAEQKQRMEKRRKRKLEKRDPNLPEQT